MRLHMAIARVDPAFLGKAMRNNAWAWDDETYVIWSGWFWWDGRWE